MDKYYLTKDIEGAVKDVDTATGTVTGYFSVFNNKDSDNDVILPGAFDKTVKENGPDSSRPRILHLYMHDPTLVLAKPKVLKPDSKGLYFESQISKTALGKDVIQLYQDKVLTEHSIGFQIVRREVDEDEDTQKLIELKLWEGSTVSWGANSEALVQSVKGENVPDKITWMRLIEKLESLQKAVEGNYTDDTARMLEIQFKQLQQLVLSLATRMKPEDPPHENKEPKFDASKLVGILKLNAKI